jgi:beta-glucanase (GH16 family)
MSMLIRKYAVCSFLAWAAVLTGAVDACSSSGADGEATDASAQVPEWSNQSPMEAGPASSDAMADRVAQDGGASPGSDAGDAGLLDGWVLTWSDEFDQPDGAPVDPAKWNQVVGAATANNELEYYTGGSTSAVVESGMLVITATTQGASEYTCSYGACKYTSARINTQSKFAQEYGRFEARIQIPRGQGLWPAWWMEGDDKPAVGWPDCGEIDIMENIGSTPSTDYGSMHGPGYSGANDLTGSYSLPDAAALADDFHVYAVEWDQKGVRFFLDQVVFETRTPADVPDGDVWVFDRPFFLILNVAVGGNWPGNPNATTSFPQVMRVDYVRVYSKAM